MTGQYFKTLQVKPALGRLMTPDDIRDAAGDPVCVLSFDLWQEHFGGHRSVVGRSILVNGHPYRVIGVSQRGFHGTELQRRTDLQAPATRVGDFMPAFRGGGSFDWMKSLSWLTPMARLQPGVPLAMAQERLVARNPSYKPAQRKRLRLREASEGFYPMRQKFGKPVVVLMAVVALVLLAACVNLANLLLARAQSRRKEFAVRASLGASRARLTRQLLAESSVLAVCGGAAGLALAFWINRTLLLYLNAGKATGAVHVPFEARVFGFAVLITIGTTALFGLVPAWRASRIDLASDFKNERGGGRRSDGLFSRRALTGLQIALSLIILLAAGLLTQTLSRLRTVDLGFEPSHLIAMQVDPAANGHSRVDTSRIYDEIVRKTRLLPGVKATALALQPPFLSSGMTLSMNIDVPGYVKKVSDTSPAIRSVGPGYFETLNQPLLAGRDFTSGDNQAAARVAVVNEKFARHYFGYLNIIGRHFRQGEGDLEIVGVVANVRDWSLKADLEEIVYWAERQSQTTALSVVARVESKPEQIMPSLLAIVRSVDARLPVGPIATVNAGIAAGLSTERMLSFLSNLFAALVTLLAGIGLYGVVAYSVAARRREIGIRVAVGARRGRVAALFLREILVLIGCGLAAGIPLALISTSFLKSLLFGLSPSDPASLAASLLVLLLAVFLAVALPLWRATRVDPVEALRCE